MKIIILCSCFICFTFSFAFSSSSDTINKMEDIQNQNSCKRFCTDVGCDMFEYRYNGCSCKTPDGCILQGDILTLDYPQKHTYVTNIKNLCDMK